MPSRLQDTSSYSSLSGTARIVRADPGTENVKVEVFAVILQGQWSGQLF